MKHNVQAKELYREEDKNEECGRKRRREEFRQESDEKEATTRAELLELV